MKRLFFFFFVFGCCEMVAASTSPSRLESFRQCWMAPDVRTKPCSVLYQKGRVADPKGVFQSDGTVCRLQYRAGEAPPILALDLGAASAGGYAVFRVTEAKGAPRLRISYACHPDGLGESGCFSRETRAQYLGPKVDIPVLPANVNRHELYTISRTGSFVAPLLQGQARYVRIQLDTPGEVAIDSFELVNAGVYAHEPMDGYFHSSDERINRLWDVSAWTCQIASFPNHDGWKCVDGWLLPRKLEEGKCAGLCTTAQWIGDGALVADFEMRINPHFPSAAGLFFRAKEEENGLVALFRQPDLCALYQRKRGENHLLAEGHSPVSWKDGVLYRAGLQVRGTQVEILVDGKILVQAALPPAQGGSFGFYSEKEWWPLWDRIQVSDSDGKILFQDDFTRGSSGAPGEAWSYARTLPYVADGAKRDRLIWSGDLYWAERNLFYLYRPESPYMRGSIRMLAFNQTPEGYVHASPYAERPVPPRSGEYGPFPSDEFAAWFVPVLWDYLLYTGDDATARAVYPNLQKLVAYLKRQLGPDGLFVQRRETSKHACNLQLGDTMPRAYLHILLWSVFRDAANVAQALGRGQDAQQYQADAERMKRVVYLHFWDQRLHAFRRVRGTSEVGFEANALALATRFVSREEALQMAPYLKKTGHGKFQALAARGKFEYGFTRSALRMIEDHNWYRLLEPAWKGALTTTECMGMIRSGWGDESHPDTAIAGLFSSYLLGIVPVEPGYRRFSFAPQIGGGQTEVEGCVPIPDGRSIFAKWSLKKGRFQADLSIPEGCVADVHFPILVRCGMAVERLQSYHLRQGRYQFTAENVLEKQIVDPTFTASVGAEKIRWSASTSHEMAGWGLSGLSAPLAAAEKGYSSAAGANGFRQEWIQADLGEVRSVQKVWLYPRIDTSSVTGGVAGFPKKIRVEGADASKTFRLVREIDLSAYGREKKPLEIDFHTVIGYPSFRYLRFVAERLGDPAADEPDVFRLQFRRVRIQ